MQQQQQQQTIKEILYPREMAIHNKYLKLECLLVLCSSKSRLATLNCQMYAIYIKRFKFHTALAIEIEGDRDGRRRKKEK
ncbi:CLUMA_CG005992, isoform A [Clunio marinus]|uniref:CLUMA_CG005992, isoform A n=1 Tax=Clunio marinus TaxID=568069 RepID=A0A1J1HYL6_9DIPT|nr:CLUMA_CG005992, isoform A [Clunio marinus]